MSEKERKIREQELRVRLLADDSVVVENLKKQLDACDTQIFVLKESSAHLNKSLVTMTRDHRALLTGLDLSLAAIARGSPSLGISPLGSTGCIHR